MVGSDGGFVIRSGKNQEKISSSANSAEHTFPVNFTDGSYQVEIQDFSQNQLYALVSWASLAAGGIIFLALMLLYNSQVTSSISRLAKQVRQVSKGDLTLEITPSSKDEIGDLAEDVERYAPVHHGQAPAGRARMAEPIRSSSPPFPMMCALPLPPSWAIWTS